MRSRGAGEMNEWRLGKGSTDHEAAEEVRFGPDGRDQVGRARHFCILPQKAVQELKAAFAVSMLRFIHASASPCGAVVPPQARHSMARHLDGQFALTATPWKGNTVTRGSPALQQPSSRSKPARRSLWDKPCSRVFTVVRNVPVFCKKKSSSRFLVLQVPYFLR